MPGITPLYGLRYPIGSDALDDAVSTIPQLNAQDVESALAGFGGIAAPGSWATPSLAFGSNFGSGYANVRYRKVGTQVFLRGVLGGLGGGLGANTTIFTLPAGFRPLATEVFRGEGVAVYANGNVRADIAVPAGGTITFSSIAFFID